MQKAWKGERKMKKSLAFMIAVFLVGAIMISCNSEVSSTNGVADGKLVTVSIGSGSTKDVSPIHAAGSSSAEVGQLYWFYTAKKTDSSIFTTGQALTKTPLKAGNTSGLLGGANNANTTDPTVVGGNAKFSTGSWEFSFYGYRADQVTYNSGYTFASGEEDKPVFQCVDYAVTITADTTITVTLEEGAGTSDAKLVFVYNSSYPEWSYDLAPAGTGLTLSVYVNDSTTALTTGTGSVSDGRVQFENVTEKNIEAGIQTLKFVVSVTSTGEKVGEATLNLNAKKGTTYYIVGDIKNLNSTYTVTITAISETVTEVQASTTTTETQVPKLEATVSPQSASSSDGTAKTSVDFSGTNLKTNATTSYKLTVDSKSDEENTTAVVTAESTDDTNNASMQVASVDLTLTKIVTSDNSETYTNVTSFKDSNNQSTSVPVETYIAKGLQNVKVGGVATAGGTNDEGYDTGISDVVYDSSTGKLTFKTSHFSSFKVRSDSVARITKNDKTTYYPTLQGAIDAAASGDEVVLIRDIVLPRLSSEAHSSAVLIEKNITLDGGYETNSRHTISMTGTGDVNNYSRVVMIDSNTVTLKNLEIKNNCTGSYQVGVHIFGQDRNVTLNNCKISTKYYAINSAKSADNLNLTILNGTISTGWAAINHHGSNANINITDSELNGDNFSNGEAFGTIVLDGNSYFYPGSTTTGNRVTITNSTVKTVAGNGTQYWVSFQFGCKDSCVVVDSQSHIYNSSDKDVKENMALGTGNYVEFVATSVSEETASKLNEVFKVTTANEKTKVEPADSDVYYYWKENNGFSEKNDVTFKLLLIGKQPGYYFCNDEYIELYKNLTIDDISIVLTQHLATGKKFFIVAGGYTIEGGKITVPDGLSVYVDKVIDNLFYNTSSSEIEPTTSGTWHVYTGAQSSN